MAQIDFYLLPGNDLSGQMLFCARLCEKAIEKACETASGPHYRIHIQTSDSIESEALNEALWNFRPESFLPHSQARAAEHIVEPISFSHEPNALSGPYKLDLLLLTQPLLPSGWTANVRTALLINQDERLIQASRQLYKNLQKDGHTLNSHDLRKR